MSKIEININNYFDKIFYINLDKDLERNTKMISQFQKWGITNYERISGTVFHEIPHNYFWRNFNTDKISIKYILGSLGARNSHFRIMEMAINRSYNKILVLEDDVEFIEDPNLMLKNNLDKLESWDMLYFGGTEEHNFNGQIVGAYAYAVNRKLIEEIYYMLPSSGMEVDNFYAKVLFHMSYNYNYTGKFLIKKIEPFNSINHPYVFKSNIRN
jgi:GR25 family glycosyltransferase involved in LPS biosynthesis